MAKLIQQGNTIQVKLEVPVELKKKIGELLNRLI